MKLFLPTLAGVLVTAVIVAVAIGLNTPHEAAVGSKAQARARELTVQLQRQANEINRVADEMDDQGNVTTNQALAFSTGAGQVVIPAGTTLPIVRRSGTDVVVQYNGIEVNLPGYAIEFH
jgi:hypothetical protein